MDDEHRYEILDVDDSLVATAETFGQAVYACGHLLTSEEDREAGYTRLRVFDVELVREVVCVCADGEGGFYAHSDDLHALV